MLLVFDLQARFLKYEMRVEKRRRVKPEVIATRSAGPYNDEDFFEDEGPVEYASTVDALADADGVWFLCPLCYAANNGSIGTHGVICWFVDKVPDSVPPKPGRWTPTGTSLHDLTFVPSAGRSHSVLLTAGCAWHGFVVNGDAS
jgi:hypothetical protein